MDFDAPISVSSEQLVRHEGMLFPRPRNPAVAAASPFYERGRASSEVKALFACSFFGYSASGVNYPVRLSSFLCWSTGFFSDALRDLRGKGRVVGCVGGATPCARETTIKFMWHSTSVVYFPAFGASAAPVETADSIILVVQMEEFATSKEDLLVIYKEVVWE